MIAQVGAVHTACLVKPETGRSVVLRTTWKTHHSVSGQCRFLPSESGMCYNRGRKRHIVLNNPGRKASDVTGSNCIHIGQVIRHAVVFNTQRWPEVRHGMDNLLNMVSDLFDLLQKRRIRYALVGDVVLLRYVQVGIPGILTLS